MATSKRDLGIPWPFAPQKVDLNSDTNLLKLVAMITMFIDHAGKMLFPQYPIMRVIGRIAFPIYAYCIAAGCVYTRNPLNYFKRVVLMALISQPLYAVALAHESALMYSVSFAEEPIRAALTFYIELVGSQHPADARNGDSGHLVDPRAAASVDRGAAAVLLGNSGRMDYGFRGLMLMVLFYLFCQKWWISLPVMVAYMGWWGLSGSGYELFDVRFGIQMFAMLALPLIYIHTKSKLKINKWVFYWFYPCPSGRHPAARPAGNVSERRNAHERGADRSRLQADEGHAAHVGALFPGNGFYRRRGG